MKFLLLVALLTAALAPGHSAFAQGTPPSPQTLARFLDAYQFEHVRGAWALKLDRDAKAEIAQWRTAPGMTPRLQAALDQYQQAVAAELQRQLSTANLRPRYAAIFGKVFSEQEMLEITRFYESPAGKASVTKRPQIAALIQEELAAIGSEMESHLKQARLQVEEAARGKSK